jgi:hypothetical protein
MFQELEAIFDRTVLEPDVPLELTVGTRVVILVLRYLVWFDRGA